MTDSEFVSFFSIFNPRLTSETFWKVLGDLKRGHSRENVAEQTVQRKVSDIEREADLLVRAGAVRIAPDHSWYPSFWKNMPLGPMGFSMLGSPCWSISDGVSVVGSREPTALSVQWMETYFSEFVEKHNAFVVSGAARGIDQIAHSIALKHQRPTVAILPSGLGEPYPAMFKSRFDEILRGGGAVISEYSFHQVMRKHHFLHRNRLIASLCRHLLLVEARRKGGSYLTARLVGENGGELGVVPSHPMSAKGRGGLDFIRSGGQMIADAEDLEVWTGFSRVGPQEVMF